MRIAKDILAVVIVFSGIYFFINDKDLSKSFLQTAIIFILLFGFRFLLLKKIEMKENKKKENKNK